MEISKKRRLNIFIGILITAFFAVALSSSRIPFISRIEILKKISPLEMIEAKLFDYRFKLRGQVKPPDNIVIAAIDEKSVERIGRWPWNRDKIALLVNKLTEAGAEIIVFDIILSETEKNDKILGKAIREAGNVILPMVFEFNRESDVSDDKFLISSALISIRNPDLFNKYGPIMAKTVFLPVPELIKEVMTLGHINMFPDSDGTLRWESLIIEYNGYLFPSITLQAAAKYLGIPHEKVELRATEGIRFGKRYISTDTWGRILINYYGPNQTFKHFSISDILDGSLNPKLFQGKIVLIGATAVGIYDLRVTPFSAAMPGIEKHASVIASLLENRLLRSTSLFINLVILLLSGFLFSFLVARFKAVGASGVMGLSLLIIFSSGYYLFAHRGIWINITYPSLNMLLIFIVVTAFNYAVEEKYARRIRAMFSSYATERLVNELIKNPDMARLGGERREITILFSDVRGFTAFSEKHAPEEVVAILNEYLDAMTEVVFKWDGTLDKFIGDAILAFWGAPMRQENHAELAVKCALGMISRLNELQKKWGAEGKAGLDIGIGINTGEVIVGNIGAEGKKMDYTVIGDHVNLGSRVESLTRKYDAHILLTEFSLNKIKDVVKSGQLGHVSIKAVENVIVKGKEKPVAIYEILSLEHGIESSVVEFKGDKVVRLKEK